MIGGSEGGRSRVGRSRDGSRCIAARSRDLKGELRGVYGTLFGSISRVRGFFGKILPLTWLSGASLPFLSLKRGLVRFFYEFLVK